MINVSEVAPSGRRTERPVPATAEARGAVDGTTVLVRAGVSSSKPDTAERPRKIRRLLASEQYFGLEALAFHAGAGRVVARLGQMREPTFDAATLVSDFAVEPGSGRALLKALVAAGVLQVDGARFRPTPLLHEYAEAHVVMPLARERAKTLIDKAMDLAARINGTWQHNRYLIDALAVSGSYMGSDKYLRDLTLWLVVRRRDGAADTQQLDPNADDALREIGAAMKAISSFVVVRAARDTQEVKRPFSVVFEATSEVPERRNVAFGSLRDLGAIIRERLRG